MLSSVVSLERVFCFASLHEAKSKIKTSSAAAEILRLFLIDDFILKVKGCKLLTLRSVNNGGKYSDLNHLGISGLLLPKNGHLSNIFSQALSLCDFCSSILKFH